MKYFNLRYLIPALILAVILGGVFTGCQAQPALAEQPTATVESYFTDPVEIIAEEIPPYTPCRDPYLKYELSEEGKQRQKQCGIEE